MISMSH